MRARRLKRGAAILVGLSVAAYATPIIGRFLAEDSCLDHGGVILAGGLCRVPIGALVRLDRWWSDPMELFLLACLGAAPGLLAGWLVYRLLGRGSTTPA